MSYPSEAKTDRSLSLIVLFAGTLFTSASLMFVLQPLFGKILLPLLGGSPAVWNTCMVFYQSILFLGYLYAHYSFDAFQSTPSNPDTCRHYSHQFPGVAGSPYLKTPFRRQKAIRHFGCSGLYFLLSACLISWFQPPRR